VKPHVARKRFGQHFLSDAAVIDAIVSAIAPQAGQHMVEIGPGLGAMTQPLVERLGALTVIELDRDLAARLRTHLQLTVIESDVLRVDFGALVGETAAPGHRLRVVGNLPYNISTPILFHLLDFAHTIEDQHFMLQKEVVDRMVAAADTADFGRLSVMLQWRYSMEDVLAVGHRASLRRLGSIVPWCGWCPCLSRHWQTLRYWGRLYKRPSASGVSFYAMRSVRI